MLAQKSLLQFRDFVIINSGYRFIQLPEQNVDQNTIENFFSEYVLDIDFMLKKEPLGQYLFAKVIVNHKDEKPGYSLLAEGVVIIDDKLTEGLDKATLMQNVTIPAINIAINQLRGYLINLTAYGPLGKYILPAIDLADLLKKKAEKARSKKVTTKS